MHTDTHTDTDLDIGSITDGSQPTLEDVSASDAPRTVHDEHADTNDEAEDADGADQSTPSDVLAKPGGRFSWKRILAYGLLPALVLILALGVAYLKWQDGSARLSQTAAVQSTQIANESTIAMLSYRPDTAEQDLTAAGHRLTGPFRDSYTKLIKEIVIPGAKEKHISAVATVPAAAPISATTDHAVVLIYVNQSIVIGDGAPTNTISSVRVTLDKVDSRWLISGFDPV